MNEIDPINIKILDELQHDASLSLAAVAETVGLSQNACWRRIKMMEESGLIRARVTLLDPDKLGLKLIVFVAIKTNQHSETWLADFSKGVARIDEVLGFYRMSGETDYLLKLIVADMADYDRVYKKLINITPLSDVTSSFVMEAMKDTTALPLTR